MPAVNSIRAVLICKAPLGGVVFSNGTADSDGTTVTQVFMINWNNFVGSGQFCFKVCFNQPRLLPESNRSDWMHA
jgi:hypothetical protein